jgi:hypothetical protein
MSLEQEIRQTTFRSEFHKALLNLIYTHNVLINSSAGFFKSYGITRQQYNVLRILRGQHPAGATIQMIRERMLDKMSDASRIVERLRAKRLASRPLRSQSRTKEMRSLIRWKATLGTSKKDCETLPKKKPVNSTACSTESVRISPEPSWARKVRGDFQRFDYEIIC